MFLCFFGFGVNLCFLLKNIFFSFSTQNHAESFGNYIKKSVLDPNLAKLNNHMVFQMHFCEKHVIVTRTCPPGVALAGPDMSEVRVLIQFRTFRVQNLLFEVISKSFCMALRGEAEKTRF